jgi:hypothetical protein
MKACRAEEAKAETARCAEEANIVPPLPPPSPPPKKGKGGKKRKAEPQLVPEDDAAQESAGPARRAVRTRLTPQVNFHSQLIPSNFNP